MTAEEFEERTAEFAERFPGRGIGEEEEPGRTKNVPDRRDVSADSLLQGIEAHGDFQLTSRLAAEVGFDYVRGSLKATDEPLPLIPPLRFRGGFAISTTRFRSGAR